jgi:formylglycine-generating enzyme required for sulfatase activity
MVVFASLAAASCKGGGGSAANADASATAPGADQDGATAAAARATPEVDAGFTSAAAALEPSATDAGSARPPSNPPAAGSFIELAAGDFQSGSTPGDEGRDPTVEPALVPVTLGAYSIDALPYPNDPAAPFKTGASIEEATKLCAERGARLCSELEWEHACKGPDGDAFATGATWNPACEKDGARCASGYRVRALGTIAELTSSRFTTTDGSESAPVLRGGTGAPSTRRCAARSRASGATGASAAPGFRCCKGPPSAPRIAPIEPRPAFKKANLEPSQLAKIFAQVPELLRIGSDLRYFTEGDIRAMTSRGSASHEGVTFLTSPVLWSPEPGAELLVATGRGRTMSFVVALWVLPGDRYRFGSSFLMLNDLSPVALAFETSRRKELRWTSCWGCNGEQGSVSYRPEDHRVVIVQQ